jgi:hypothetical protein
MNKFEKLIEYIINEDEAKAKALFHQIVVEKSRDIYESLVDEDGFPVQQGRGAERLGQEISNDQDVIDGDHIGEADDEFGGDELGGDELGGGEDDLGGDEFGGDELDGGEEDFGGDEFGGEEGGGSVEDRVMDLEDAIDELKAEFDQLMAGEEGEADLDGEEDFGGEEGGDDFGGEEEVSDFDGEDEEGVGQDELGDESEGEGENKFGEASVYGGQTGNSKTMESKEADKKAKDAKAKKEKEAKAKKDKDVKESRKSPADLMREYVEKVSQNWPNGASEGDAIGSGGEKSPINSKSNVISGKNDMGGTTANIAQGKFASDRDDNKSAKKPSNYLTKGEKKMGQDKYENSPAANTKGYKDKQSAKTKEGSTTKDSAPVVKKSFNPGGKPGF